MSGRVEPEVRARLKSTHRQRIRPRAGEKNLEGTVFEQAPVLVQGAHSDSQKRGRRKIECKEKRESVRNGTDLRRHCARIGLEAGWLRIKGQSG
jgi:hypothetical protein